MHPQDITQKLSDLAERSERHRGGFRARRPKALSDVLAQLLAKRNYAATQANEQLAEAWTTAAGPRLAPHSRATRIHRSLLEVTVAHSPMMQEITFEKKRILAALQAALPDAKINDLKLRVGKIN